MSLEMRVECEKCHAALEHGDLAFICSYECTFCPTCAVTMGQRCPNCQGEQVRRGSTSTCREPAAGSDFSTQAPLTAPNLRGDEP